MILVIVIALVAVYFFSMSKKAPNDSSNNQQQQQTPTDNTNVGMAEVKYTNSQYGFDFVLPVSWEGYFIVEDKWEGYNSSETTGQVLVVEGPQLSIRHPLWTSAQPRQDIPIMVFTIVEWNDMQADKFHIGAAPINPSELGRNNKNVFALPARYNYAFPVGYEEVEKILEGKPLHAFDI